MNTQLIKQLTEGDFVELVELSNMFFDLKYACENNFLGKNLYGSFKKVFLHKIAAQKIMQAVEILKEENPQLKFIVFDALRPQSVQKVLWEHVVGTPQEIYVANPERGSIHSFGMAIDLALVDSNNVELDMGTGFDDFNLLSQPKLEEQFLKEKKLSPKQLQNRLLLRRCMERAGFIQLPHEWWHFDALPAEEVRAKFEMIK